MVVTYNPATNLPYATDIYVRVYVLDGVVSLEIGDRKLGALIVWRNDFYAGLLFDTYLTEEQVQELARFKPEASDGK